MDDRSSSPWRTEPLPRRPQVARHRGTSSRRRPGSSQLKRWSSARDSTSRAPRATGSRTPPRLFLSQDAGFTQSETSTAWCGNNVVAGYNDSGSFLESLVLSFGGLSFNGVARSTNRGASFTDLIFLNPGPPQRLPGRRSRGRCTQPHHVLLRFPLPPARHERDLGLEVHQRRPHFRHSVPAALKPTAHFLDKNMMAGIPPATASS